MISKCPECGRSYPTHHGEICKLCASKNKPVEVKTVTPEVKSITKEVETPKPIVKEVQEVKKIEEPSIQETLVPSGDSSKSKSMEDYKIEGLMDVCPACGLPNAKSDMFCTNCGKMLLNTQKTGNNKEYKISDIKGAFPDQITKLKKLDITNTLQLIDKGLTPTKRKTLATKSGIPEIMIYRLVNQADLLRIDGVEPNEAYLLENIGLNTMKVLERRTYEDISNAIKTKKSLLYSKQIIILPEDKLIKKWVEQIKNIEKLVIPNSN
ncbi:MAG: DUF4332 domain-containing protein [Candidatus Sericytochromatia bacterium]